MADTAARIVHPIPPVVDESCRLLILGSFPSVKSREEGFFYGHPQNRFWRMLAAILSEDVPTTIAEKQSLLLRHHIALWDVIASCEIQGSSDTSVRNAMPVDIGRITRVAHIKGVICNGALAGRLYRRYLQPSLGMEGIVLPSTSPANAAWSLDRLIAAWKPFLHLQAKCDKK